MKQNLKPKMELLECNYITQVCVHIQKLDYGFELVALNTELSEYDPPSVCESTGGSHPNQGGWRIGQ